jgi:alpha-L-rhamnosidase
MKKSFTLIIFISFIFSAHGQAPRQLRCDFLLHTSEVSSSGIQVNEPIVSAVKQKTQYQFASIYSEQPVFNWEVDTSIKKVSAYRILVASSMQLLKSNSADLWDSKKIKTSHSRASYDGKTLVPG